MQLQAIIVVLHIRVFAFAAKRILRIEGANNVAKQVMVRRFDGNSFRMTGKFLSAMSEISMGCTRAQNA